LRALFYSTSLLEAVLVKQVVEILKGLAKIVNNVFNQFKFFGCSSLRVLKADALCNFCEVFFCHGVFLFFVFCWLVIERLKPVAFDIFSECQEKIEHGKDEDGKEDVGDEFVDGLHILILVVECFLSRIILKILQPDRNFLVLRFLPANQSIWKFFQHGSSCQCGLTLQLARETHEHFRD
jgi:hypothetical protein